MKKTDGETQKTKSTLNSILIEKVIESATLKSIVIENGISTPARKDSEISKFETLDNLKDALNKAIKDEEYEIAAKLRDKITNIEGNS